MPRIPCFPDLPEIHGLLPRSSVRMKANSRRPSGGLRSSCRPAVFRALPPSLPVVKSQLRGPQTSALLDRDLRQERRVVGSPPFLGNRPAVPSQPPALPVPCRPAIG